MGDVSDHKSPVDQALDLLVYAPLGFALDARTLLPKLVARGRSQVDVARWMGEHAVAKGQKGASRRLSMVQEQAVVGAGRPRPAAQRQPRPGGTARRGHPSRPRSVRRKAARPGPDHDRGRRRPGHPGLRQPRGVAGDPPARGLSPEELEAVRAYEAGRRGRKTILNKIAQLQG